MANFALFKQAVENFEGTILLDLSGFGWPWVLAKQMMLQQSAGACGHCMRKAEHQGFCVGISVAFIMFYEDPASFKKLLLKDDKTAETIVRCQINHFSRRGDHYNHQLSDQRSPTDDYLEGCSYPTKSSFQGTDKVGDFACFKQILSENPDCYFKIYYFENPPGKKGHSVVAWNNTKESEIIFFDPALGIARFSGAERMKRFGPFLHCHITVTSTTIDAKKWCITIHKKTEEIILNLSDHDAAIPLDKAEKPLGKETSV